MIYAANLKDVLDLIQRFQRSFETLVVLDIDGVVLRPSPFRQYFLESLTAEDIDQSSRDLLCSVVDKIETTRTRFKNERQFNGKKEIQELISFLDQSLIKTICITHLGSGDSRFYHDRSLIKTEDWRIDNIKPYDTFFKEQHVKFCETA